MCYLKNMSYDKHSVENKMVHNWLNSLSVNEFEYMKNAVFNINIFLILQKGFNQHQPPETNRRPELGLKSEFQDQVSTRPPWGTPPTPSHTLACSFMGVGNSHLLWIWFCSCVALELIDLLTFEKIREKCIKDAHCKVSYVFLYILLMKFAQIQNSLPIWNHLWFIAICFESDSAFESGCNMWSIHNTV